jgi:hypothetical protein
MSDPCKFVGVEGEKCDRLHQLLKDNPCRATSKTKRAPSAYNLYVKECIKNKGGIRKFGEAAPIMRQCATEYKEDKSKGQFRYKFDMPTAQSSGSSAQLYKGRDLQAEWRDLHRRVSGGKR